MQRNGDDFGNDLDTNDVEDRRSLLKKVGVGAAMAWTAPLLLSGPASAGPGTAQALQQCIAWGTTPVTRQSGQLIPSYPFVLPIGAYPITATPGAVQFSLERPRRGRGRQ